METEKKKKKRTTNYSILFVPDLTTKKVKSFTLSHNLLHAIILGIFVFFCMAFVYVFYLINHMQIAQTSIMVLKEQIKQVEAENKQLEVHNKELVEKVSILSGTVNVQEEEKKEQEIEFTEKHMPTGFPLKGTATYHEGKVDTDQTPILMFSASVGTDVIPTGNGVVTEIGTKEGYGYYIEIDHENGYKSYYYDNSVPLVEKDAEVTKSTVLFTIQAGGETLGYQIKKDNDFIDPLTLLEING